MYGVSELKIKNISTGKSEYTEKEILAHKQKAQELMDKGYLRVSNKGCVLSRVDRKDWRKHMAKEHAPWSQEEGNHWVTILGQSAADQYRRVYSEDKIKVPYEVSRYVDSSCHNAIDFIS